MFLTIVVAITSQDLSTPTSHSSIQELYPYGFHVLCPYLLFSCTKKKQPMCPICQTSFFFFNTKTSEAFCNLKLQFGDKSRLRNILISHPINWITLSIERRTKNSIGNLRSVLGGNCFVGIHMNPHKKINLLKKLGLNQESDIPSSQLPFVPP